MPSVVSTNYTCHTWIKDTARIVVATEEGDVMLLDCEGVFLAYIPESPRHGMRIECLILAQHGLIVAGLNGHIWTYNSSSNEEVHYSLCKHTIENE